METQPKFVRLTKANKAKDRLLISTDAICTVEECREEECTKVYTMDGFWYSVVDPIEKLDKILGGVATNRNQPDNPKDVTGETSQDEQKRGKVAFVRKRKMLPPGVEKPQERHSTSENGDSHSNGSDNERKDHP